MSYFSSYFLIALILACITTFSLAFQSIIPPPLKTSTGPRAIGVGPHFAATARLLRDTSPPKRKMSEQNGRQDKRKAQQNVNFLVKDFATYAGEVVQPYQVLKVARDADRSEIRQAYIELSKRYHPDATLHHDVQPGSCNSDVDIREEWERIKLSYEILKDHKRRLRFDRHEILLDPAAALRRAAMDAVGAAVSNIGLGILRLGAFCVQQAAKGAIDRE